MNPIVVFKPHLKNFSQKKTAIDLIALLKYKIALIPKKIIHLKNF